MNGFDWSYLTFLLTISARGRGWGGVDDRDLNHKQLASHYAASLSTAPLPLLCWPCLWPTCLWASISEHKQSASRTKWHAPQLSSPMPLKEHMEHIWQSGFEAASSEICLIAMFHCVLMSFRCRNADDRDCRDCFKSSFYRNPPSSLWLTGRKDKRLALKTCTNFLLLNSGSVLKNKQF